VAVEKEKDAFVRVLRSIRLDVSNEFFQLHPHDVETVLYFLLVLFFTNEKSSSFRFLAMRKVSVRIEAQINAGVDAPRHLNFVDSFCFIFFIVRLVTVLVAL